MADESCVPVAPFHVQLTGNLASKSTLLAVVSAYKIRKDLCLSYRLQECSKTPSLFPEPYKFCSYPEL